MKHRDWLYLSIIEMFLLKEPELNRRLCWKHSTFQFSLSHASHSSHCQLFTLQVMIRKILVFMTPLIRSYIIHVFRLLVLLFVLLDKSFRHGNWVKDVHIHFYIQTNFMCWLDQHKDHYVLDIGKNAVAKETSRSANGVWWKVRDKLWSPSVVWKL